MPSRHPFHRVRCGSNLGRVLGFTVGAYAMVAASARADVFNMGGAQNPNGSWTGVASLTAVPVGNPGNARDPNTGFGEVDYSYNIGEFDVTAAQYTAFLNAVAATSDPYGLYNPNMGSGNPSQGCGIAQVYDSSTGVYTYTTTKNPNFPVNYVSFWDACRFANWLQNGQPKGAEGAGTTETGAYTLTATGIANNTVTRNTGTTWALPSENEWYKAAYYDPTLSGGSGGYWTFATRTNAVPSNVLSPTGTNNANYFGGSGAGNSGYADPVNFLTPVGYFAGSPSAYGTFDQAGDVWQWDDTIINGSSRAIEGGSLEDAWFAMWSTSVSNPPPTFAYEYNGFRVVELAVPEPASLGILGIGIIGVLTRRRGAHRYGRRSPRAAAS